MSETEEVVDNELGAFLRDRRSRRQPHELGLPSGRRRRVPGLRREELAILAGVSPDHYQRIEQGRVQPSSQVVDALATPLALDDTERAHLHDLARTGPERPPVPRARPVDRESVERLQALVDSFRGPAYVLDHRRDLIAWNRMAAALHIDFATVPARDRNMIWLLLTDPALRALYPDWETVGRTQVGLLRRAHARYPGDDRIRDLVERLSARCPDFELWWRSREVTEGTAGTKELRHPRVGTVRLGYQVLHPAGFGALEVFTYYAMTPDAARRLARLGRS